MERFGELVAREMPDVLALQEIDLGSIRTTLGDQAAVIADRLDGTGASFEYRADCKYGPDRILSGAPGFRKMSNMICWHEKTGTAEARYLSPGVKQLVHVLHHEDVTVIAVHLPTTTDARQHQLTKLATIASNHERVVVVGDFNLFNGVDELAPFTDELGFERHSPGETYPTADPEQAFDIVLSSPAVTVEQCRVHEDIRFSDHLPITAEIS